MTEDADRLERTRILDHLHLRAEQAPEYADLWKEWFTFWRKGNWQNGGPERRLHSCVAAVLKGDKHLLYETLEIGDLVSDDDMNEAWRIASAFVATARDIIEKASSKRGA